MIKGLILAGGKSTRFGSNKALAVYQGQSFLDRGIGVLQTMGLEVLISASKQTNYQTHAAGVIIDIYDEKGPLGGIVSAMSLHEDTDFLVLTCDMPRMDAHILKRLINRYQYSGQACFYSSGDSEVEPFPGIYLGQFKSLIEKRISEDRLSMRDFLSSVDNKNTLLFEANTKKIMNINTKREWELLNS